MSVRQRRFWWSVGLLGALVTGVSISYLWATGSESGREWLRGKLVAAADGAFKGRGHLRVGVLRDVGWGHVRMDSVAITDANGTPVLQVVEAEGSLDIAALYGGRVHIRSLAVRGVRLELRKDVTGPWNFAYVLSGDANSGPKGPPGYGDNIVVDHVQLTDGEITTRAPWSPHPIFTGHARDSVIALRDSLHDLERTPRGLFERRRITLDRVVAHDGVITQPNKKPSSMAIDSLRGLISDPPVKIVAASGQVTWTPDSLRLDLPSLQLPASRGSAAGKVWWNQPGAVRFDVMVKAQATLSDLTWVWDVLPPGGAGTANVHMRTLESADDAEYTLTDLDVRAMESHVTGRISVLVRPADVMLRRVDLAFTPLKSDLLRRLSYESLPKTVHGSVEGRLIAETGGPLKRFLIDRIDARFSDSTVAGAISSLRASGLVTMGAAPAAQNVLVDTLSVDLRSARQLAPTAPNVDGRLEGRLRVVSADLKTANLRDLALVWTDAVGNTSAVRGDVAVGYGLTVPTVSANLTLDPLSMRALARVDTTLGIRSAIRGAVTATGTLDSLTYRASLFTDSSSRVNVDGFAMLKGSDWRVAANGTVQSLDAHAWSARDDVPNTAISGTVRAIASGTRDSAGVLALSTAHADVAMRQSEGAERPAFDLLGTGSLDASRLRVDSATMHIGGVTLDAHGALQRRATTGASADTMVVSAAADTLDLVRRQLTRLAATLAPIDSARATSLRAFAEDTVKGDASLSGYLVGSLDDFDATLALGARDLQVGAIRVGRIFGSLQAKDVLTRAAFDGVATTDAIDGLGAVKIASAELKVQRASPDSGQLSFDASSPNDSHLLMRGSYQRADGVTTVLADSVRFTYDSVSWRNSAAIRITSDANGFRLDSLSLLSSARGLVSLRAVLPNAGAIQAAVRLERFPVGEAVSFAMGTQRITGVLTGDVAVAGTRALPTIDWKLVADSLGLSDAYLPRIVSDGSYKDRQAVANATITDSVGGRLHAEARVPVDLSLDKVDKRLLTDAVDIDVTADSLHLDALGFTVPNIDRVRGSLAGAVMVHGTFDRPVATGSMTLENFSVLSTALGIEPGSGRAVIRAAQDSLILESFRVRSGRVSDTLGATGVLRFARNEPVMVDAKLYANNAVLARQRDGTDLVLSGMLDVHGPLSRPAVSGNLYVPSATIIVDPLGASTALDLTSTTAREYLSPSEIPAVQSAGRSLTNLGQFATVSNTRVDFGNEVWVRTPEATIKLTGGVSLSTKGEALVPEGEITTNRGQYRLNLSVVQRSFSVDSGTVRFFGDTALAPTVDLTATNVVRLTSGDEIPVGVRVGGTIERPIITLSSSDPLYASAPESEIISLLIFGAPTFALDGQSQSTVRAVTGVVVPTIGGVVEGQLQRLLPIFNTVQVTTAGGQSEVGNASSFLDNLAITAGKQIGERTFLRLNTGVCRGSAQSGSNRGASLWYGVAAEYRIARGWTGQVGVDPGAAPCSRLSGDPLPLLQFGFDLFREWIF